MYIYILTELHFDFKYNIFQSGTKIFFFFFAILFFLFKENPNSLTAVPAPWLRLREQIPSHPFFASRSRSHTACSLSIPPFFFQPFSSRSLRPFSFSSGEVSPLSILPLLSLHILYDLFSCRSAPPTSLTSPLQSAPPLPPPTPFFPAGLRFASI